MNVTMHVIGGNSTVDPGAITSVCSGSHGHPVCHPIDVYRDLLNMPIKPKTQLKTEHLKRLFRHVSGKTDVLAPGCE